MTIAAPSRDRIFAYSKFLEQKPQNFSIFFLSEMKDETVTKK